MFSLEGRAERHRRKHGLLPEMENIHTMTNKMMVASGAEPLVLVPGAREWLPTDVVKKPDRFRIVSFFKKGGLKNYRQYVVNKAEYQKQEKKIDQKVAKLVKNHKLLEFMTERKATDEAPSPYTAQSINGTKVQLRTIAKMDSGAFQGIAQHLANIASFQNNVRNMASVKNYMRDQKALRTDLTQQRKVLRGRKSTQTGERGLELADRVRMLSHQIKIIDENIYDAKSLLDEHVEALEEYKDFTLNEAAQRGGTLELLNGLFKEKDGSIKRLGPEMRRDIIKTMQNYHTMRSTMNQRAGLHVQKVERSADNLIDFLDTVSQSGGRIGYHKTYRHNQRQNEAMTAELENIRGAATLISHTLAESARQVRRTHNNAVKANKAIRQIQKKLPAPGAPGRKGYEMSVDAALATLKEGMDQLTAFSSHKDISREGLNDAVGHYQKVVSNLDAMMARSPELQNAHRDTIADLKDTLNTVEDKKLKHQKELDGAKKNIGDLTRNLTRGLDRVSQNIAKMDEISASYTMDTAERGQYADLKRDALDGNQTALQGMYDLLNTVINRP
ncbi:MAG: hypothetical protein KAW41_00640 [Candidatus Diapherotrites archaeon]|nr:hypothetical protein [Candidatus Diapherotrites archaeon]